MSELFYSVTMVSCHACTVLHLFLGSVHKLYKAIFYINRRTRYKKLYLTSVHM